MNVEKNTEEHPASLVGEHVRGEAVVTSDEGQVPSGCVMSMCATLHPPVVLLQRVRFIAQYLGGGSWLPGSQSKDCRAKAMGWPGITSKAVKEKETPPYQQHCLTNYKLI